VSGDASGLWRGADLSLKTDPLPAPPARCWSMRLTLSDIILSVARNDDTAWLSEIRFSRLALSSKLSDKLADNDTKRVGDWLLSLALCCESGCCAPPGIDHSTPSDKSRAIEDRSGLSCLITGRNGLVALPRGSCTSPGEPFGMGVNEFCRRVVPVAPLTGACSELAVPCMLAALLNGTLNEPS